MNMSSKPRKTKNCRLKHCCQYRSIKIHLIGKYIEEVFDSPKEVFEGKCILEPTKGNCLIRSV